MNKRYYEHTLPIIRGSLSNTYTASNRQRNKLKNNKYETNSNSIIARIHHFDSN